MKSNQAIQFRGVENVLDAYRANAVPSWALFCGNQLLFQSDTEDISEGENELREIFTRMKKNNNPQATYSLCVYEGLGENERITNKTPYTGSFNFRLNEYDQERAAFNEPVLQELQMLRERIDEIEGGEVTTPKNAALATINGILEHPKFIEAIVTRVLGFVDQLFPAQPLAAASVGSTSTIEPPPALTDQDLNRLNLALDRLYKRDPQLVTHLEKLAELADQDPAQFGVLLTVLNAK